MKGLNEKEVLISRARYGTNQINVGKHDSFLKLFINSLKDPIIKILLIALGIKLIFLFQDFDWYETVGIIIAIIITTLISSISEYGSSKAFEKLLSEASKLKCQVLRNEKITEIPIEDIVVDDIMLLSAGDKIGADGIVIEGTLEVDESSMNGETTSINKNINDIVYRGCVIYSGNAYIKVTEVGNNTYYGKMVQELGEKSGSSPLKERLTSLAILLSKIGYLGALLVGLSSLFNNIVLSNNFNLTQILTTITNFPTMLDYLIEALTLSVTIIVVSVPEGLPMMVTLVLSSNMKKMLKNNVLVRKLVGIETAGSLNILFTDKTGTLTKGKLEVVGGILGNGKNFTKIEDLTTNYKEILTKSLLYNNESNLDNNSGKVIGGNITDKAILEFIKNTTISKGEILDRQLFDSSNKYSTVQVLDNNKKIKYLKGAAELLLAKSTTYLAEDGLTKKPLNKQKLETIIKKEMNKGIRIIAVALLDTPNQDDLSNLTLLGFLKIKDDIREESIEGINLIKKAGIQPVMITGDNKNTALSIAKEVGIITNDEDLILSSDELTNLTDNEVIEILPRLRVVSRAMPKDKSRLVNIAKQCNLVVGMTGDGVNDAIALKKSDVGFAMGSGTEVAKEAGDIVILDDNILSISKAILYGRTIFKSIRKFIIFQLTINLCAVGVSIIAPFLGIQTPITVIQMLWINLVIDTLAGLAFSYEPALTEYMEEKPKKRNDPIINKYMFNEIIITGIYSIILCLFFLKSNFISNQFRNTNNLMTAFFGLFVFISIFNSFNARTIRLNILDAIFQNKIFLIITGFIILIQVVIMYYGGSLFRTTSLNLHELTTMLLLALTVIPIDILRKLWLKKKGITATI